MGIEAEYEGIPYDLVVEGKVMHENLKTIGKNEKWLDKELDKFNTKSKDVLIATINGKGEIFCQTKSSKT